ncbi:RHS repeat-associated core domain-containing protein [Paenibacillus elgii]|uniref:RHS repeat-associated core domain-containing protein n=1 Tax=Paenibacillus elgii TaxID=189691 RepID=UPI0009DA8B47
MKRSEYTKKKIVLYFRYYLPHEGVYTQPDPVGLAGGNPTLYAYVGDPDAWIDPFGLNTLPSLPNRVIVSSGSTSIVHYYADLVREHADPIHFYIEENGNL